MVLSLKDNKHVFERTIFIGLNAQLEHESIEHPTRLRAQSGRF